MIAYVIDPEGEYADTSPARPVGRVFSPGVPGQGMNPFVVGSADPEELLQRIGSLRRLVEVMVGERLSAERRAALDHALASYYAQPHERSGFRDFYRFLEANDSRRAGQAAQAIRVGQSQASALGRRRRPPPTRSLGHGPLTCHLLEPELRRPPPRWVCTEDGLGPLPHVIRDQRLLVVDEVWSIMQHPEGAAFMVSMAKRARKTSTRSAVSSRRTCRTCCLRTRAARSPATPARALLQNAAFKLLLQQDAAAISTVGDAFDLPHDLQRWLLSCPRGDGLLLAQGQRFPIRIEATPEERRS